MKVKELVEFLQGLPNQEALVWVETKADGVFHTTTVKWAYWEPSFLVGNGYPVLSTEGEGSYCDC